MEKEWEALDKNNTFYIVDLPKDNQPIGCKWVKLKSDGSIERFKARQKQPRDRFRGDILVQMATIIALIVPFPPWWFAWGGLHYTSGREGWTKTSKQTAKSWLKNGRCKGLNKNDDFIKRSGSDITLAAVYVDDMILTDIKSSLISITQKLASDGLTQGKWTNALIHDSGLEDGAPV